MTNTDVVAWICVIAIIGLCFVLFGLWTWWQERKGRK